MYSLVHRRRVQAHEAGRSVQANERQPGVQQHAKALEDRYGEVPEEGGHIVRVRYSDSKLQRQAAARGVPLSEASQE